MPRVVRFVAKLILASSTFGSTCVQAQVNQHKQACSAAQAQAINAAVSEARTALNRAIDTFVTPTSADVTRQKRWFGALSSSSAQAVRKKYEAALGALNFTQTWCPLSNDLAFKWDVGDLAAVHPSAPGQIFFTPTYFSRGVQGVDSQMGTLIHELSHIVGVGLSPEVYQVANCLALAISSPARAQNNSDSFEYYVEDLLFGIP